MRQAEVAVMGYFSSAGLDTIEHHCLTAVRVSEDTTFVSGG
jgi:hypothetical protein